MMRCYRRAWVIGMGLFGVLGLCIAHTAQAGTTTRVSVNSAGEEATGGGIGRVSESDAISADGRFVAFTSRAMNLVTNDTNEEPDIFVHDQQVGTTTRVSVDSAGGEATGGASSMAAISGDGRYVAFVSSATNLVASDNNEMWDVFVHDNQGGTTTRVSVNSAGGEATGGNSFKPAISEDGRYVTFASAATNLAPNDANEASDIFVHDRQGGTTTRVSVDSAGEEATGGNSFNPAISEDGRFVAYHSWAVNLVFEDTNGARDVFVYDRQLGITTRESVNTAGEEARYIDAQDRGAIDPDLSRDGRYVAFASDAINLDGGGARQDVFIRDRQMATTTRVSKEGDFAFGSGPPSLSGDGRYVAFRFGLDSFHVPIPFNIGLQDVFVHDRQTGMTTLVSVNLASEDGNGDSFSPALSADGRYVAFDSGSSDLVAGDGNNEWDVFVHDRGSGLAPPGACCSRRPAR